MPLSKIKQAEYMRNYRAEKRGLGITHRNIRGFTNPVIPKPESVIECLREMPLVSRQDRADKQLGVEYVDADGYPVYED